MSNDMENLPQSILQAIVVEVVIPEALAAARALFHKTGTLPTDADVLQALNLTTDRFIALGESFLAKTDRPSGGTTTSPSAG